MVRQLLPDRMLPVSHLVEPHLLLSQFPGTPEDPKRTSPFLSTWKQLPFPTLPSLIFANGSLQSFCFSPFLPVP